MEGTPIIIKKKKAHGHAHHGGSWKVAYADFVTAMMAFFMVMWILGLSDESKAQISGYFNDPLGYAKTAPMSRNIVKFPGTPITQAGTVKNQGVDIIRNNKKQVIMVMNKVMQALENAGKGGQQSNVGKGDLKKMLESVTVEMTPEGLRIEFREDKGAVFFESGSSILRPEARALVAQIAPILEDAGRPLKIEGHTDAVPYARRDYDNWDLSQDRANALRRQLMTGGVASNQFLSVAGYADTRLRNPDKPESSVNRRVAILLPMPEGESDGGIREIAEPNIRAKAIELKPKIDITQNKPVQHPGKEEKNFWDGGH